MDEAPAARLERLIVGFQVSQAIHVAAVLGIADLLADGPRTSDELAAQTDANPGSLYRLLRALASVGVFHEEGGRRFALTPVGESLRSDVPGSLRGWAAFVGRPYFREAWSQLEHSIRTGENAFQYVHGTDVWSYRAERPEESVIFDLAMEALTGASNRALLDAYDFSRFGTVIDIGGGNGVLLAALLTEYPTMQGIVFDQPHVVANSEARLLLIERIVGPPNEDPRTKFGDLNMLVAPAGRERTIEEWEALLKSAGFRLVEVTPTASGLAVIEAAPA